MAVEIERVYLLRQMPPQMPEGQRWMIEQGYLPPDPTQAIAEGRLRRTTLPDGTVRHVHTVKQGVGLVRQEHERTITQQEFNAAWPRTLGCRLRKERTRVPHDGLVWEVDQFLDLPLVLAECELPTEHTALTLPPWLAPWVEREVTHEPAFRNYHLARQAGLGGGQAG